MISLVDFFVTVVGIHNLNAISLTDFLMSGVSMFALKFPSLLKFDEAKDELELKHNFRVLYDLEKAPSQTYMRER